MREQFAHDEEPYSAEREADLGAIKRLALRSDLIADKDLAINFVHNVSMLADEMLVIDAENEDSGRLGRILDVSEVLLSKPNCLSDKHLFDIISGVGRIGAGCHEEATRKLAERSVGILEGAYFGSYAHNTAKYVIIDEIEKIAASQGIGDEKAQHKAAEAMLYVIFNEQSPQLRECASAALAETVARKSFGSHMLKAALEQAKGMKDEAIAADLLCELEARTLDAARELGGQGRKIWINSTSDPLIELARFVLEAGVSGPGSKAMRDKVADAYFNFINHALDTGHSPAVFIMSFEKLLDAGKCTEYARCRMIYWLGKIMYGTKDTKVFHDAKSAFEKHSGDVALEFLQAMRDCGWQPEIMKAIGTSAMLRDMEGRLNPNERDKLELLNSRLAAHRRKISGANTSDAKGKGELSKMFPKKGLNLN